MKKERHRPPLPLFLSLPPSPATHRELPRQGGLRVAALLARARARISGGRGAAGDACGKERRERKLEGRMRAALPSGRWSPLAGARLSRLAPEKCVAGAGRGRQSPNPAGRGGWLTAPSIV